MANPPHLPPLDETHEIKPARIHQFYTTPPALSPQLYASYKVQDGDTLSNIAARTGLSAKGLMNIVFGTIDPREVNWYLRNKVGCKIYGPEKRNYAFSSSADPGLIWMEHRYVVKLTKKPVPADHSFKISKLLPAYVQKNSQGCWAASIANIYDWKNYSGRRTSDKALYEIGDNWGKKYDAGDYLKGPEFKILASEAGLKEYKLGNFLDDNEWMDTLKKNGPFLILQHARGDWLHWLVVRGYELTAADGLWIRVFDPGGGRMSAMEVGLIYEKCLTAHTAHARVYGY